MLGERLYIWSYFDLVGIMEEDFRCKSDFSIWWL